MHIVVIAVAITGTLKIYTFLWFTELIYYFRSASRPKELDRSIFPLGRHPHMHQNLPPGPRIKNMKNSVDIKPDFITFRI